METVDYMLLAIEHAMLHSAQHFRPPYDPPGGPGARISPNISWKQTPPREQ